jgi:tetratricopeptide (TPR) repeat protein
LRLARLLAEQGHWTEATEVLRQLTEGNPGFAPARLALAQAAAARNANGEALELAGRCVEDPRTRRAAWSLLSALQRREGNTAASDDAARRVAGLPADDAVADSYEAEIFSLRGDPRGLSTQAHGLLAAGRLEAAAVLVDRLERDHAGVPETWLLAGRLQLLRKEFGGAEQSLRRLLQLDPQSTQGLFQLGMVMLGQNRFTEAAEIFQQATLLKRDFGPAYFNRAFALGRNGQWRDAVAPFQECIKYNPEYLQAYLLLADVHLQLGETLRAIEVLDQAERLSPGDPRLAEVRLKAMAP